MTVFGLIQKTFLFLPPSENVLTVLNISYIFYKEDYLC